MHCENYTRRISQKTYAIFHHILPVVANIFRNVVCHNCELIKIKRPTRRLWPFHGNHRKVVSCWGHSKIAALAPVWLADQSSLRRQQENSSLIFNAASVWLPYLKLQRQVMSNNGKKKKKTRQRYALRHCPDATGISCAVTNIRLYSSAPRKCGVTRCASRLSWHARNCHTARVLYRYSAWTAFGLHQT